MRIFKIILGLLMCMTNNLNSESDDHYRLRKTIVHQAINDAVIDIQKKYNLQLGGILEEGDKTNNKYKIIGLSFVSKKVIPKNEARKITVDISRIFLEKLNQDKVKPFLTVNPFTEKNIDISVTFAIAEDWDYSDVAFFGTDSGNVFYWYKLSNEEFKTRKERETFEEALKIIEQEKINNKE